MNRQDFFSKIRRFSDEEFLKIYKLGWSDKRIANEFNVSHSSVRIRRFKLGMKCNFNNKNSINPFSMKDYIKKKYRNVVVYNREYRKRDYVRKQRFRYSREYYQRLEVKEHRREYERRFEVKDKKKKYVKKNNIRIKKYQENYRKDNKLKIKELSKNYYNKNKESLLKNMREYSKNNRYLMNKLARRNYRKYKNNVNYKLNRNFSCLVRQSLFRNKGGKMWQGLVGYSLIDLKKNLESNFKEGMSWSNYGEWHIDHIIPKSKFKFKDYLDDEFKKCWSLNNLQPLWAIDNIKKGNKIL